MQEPAIDSTDDWSHFTGTCLMKSMDEVPQMLNDYKQTAEANWGKIVERIRCYNGGKYTFSSIKSFYKSNGIVSLAFHTL